MAGRVPASTRIARGGECTLILLGVHEGNSFSQFFSGPRSHGGDHDRDLPTNNGSNWRAARPSMSPTRRQTNSM